MIDKKKKKNAYDNFGLSVQPLDLNRVLHGCHILIGKNLEMRIITLTVLSP